MSCHTIPTATLFGTATGSGASVSTSFSNQINTAQDRTTTITQTTCSPTVVANSSTCVDQFVTTTSVIKGATNTVRIPIDVTVPAGDITTFPTATLYSTSCDTTSSSSSSSSSTTPTSTTPIPTTTPPPTSTSTSSTSSDITTSSESSISSSPPTSSAPPISTSLTTSISNGTVSYSLSTPAPTTITTVSAVTLDGKVISTTVAISSNFPASTIYNVGSGGGGGGMDKRNVGMIGGVVGGVVLFCIGLGVAMCLWRRRRRNRNFEFEKEVSDRYGRRLSLDMDDDDAGGASHPAPYQYGLVGGTSAPRPDSPHGNLPTAYKDNPDPVPRLSSTSSPPGLMTYPPTAVSRPSSSSSPPLASPVPSSMTATTSAAHTHLMDHRTHPSLAPSLSSNSMHEIEMSGMSGHRTPSQTSMSGLIPKLRVANDPDSESII